MRTVALAFLFVLGTALGSPTWKPRGVGAARRLPGRPSPYIVGGDVVQGRQYPGQVSIEFYGMNSCGGSIINENYILTAAHCSDYDPKVLNVLSGTNDLFVGGTQHRVSEIVAHEKYNSSDSWRNDIAVMKVDPPFVFDDATAPVKLPTAGQETPAGSVATVIGWGRLSEEGIPPKDLRKVNIFISDHASCDQIYQEDGGFKIYDEQICAGTTEGNMGPCHGDSGGPLFVNGQVIGVVSWSRGCAEKGYPAVYTEVSDYIDWIESKVGA